MSYGEVIPPTNPHRQFPTGDIFPRQADKAIEWLENLISPTDNEAKFHRIGRALNFDSRGHVMTQASLSTHNTAMQLCSVWDKYDSGIEALEKECDPIHESPRQAALAGYLLAKATVVNSQFVPSVSSDFSTELNRMKDEHVNDYAWLAQNALGHMEQSHPQVHRVYEQMRTVIDDAFAYNDDETARAQAGMTLPYTLASTQRLMPRKEFTGIDATIPDPDENITKYFIDDVSLETRNPANRLRKK